MWGRERIRLSLFLTLEATGVFGASCLEMLAGSPCSTTLKATQRQGRLQSPYPTPKDGSWEAGKSLLQMGVLSPSVALMSGSWIRRAPPYSPACTVSCWPLVSLGPAYLFQSLSAASCPGPGRPQGCLCSPFSPQPQLSAGAPMSRQLLSRWSQPHTLSAASLHSLRLWAQEKQAKTPSWTCLGIL